MKAVVDARALERAIGQEFDFHLAIERLILPWSDVGRTAKAAVIMTKKKQLVLYLKASSPMTLADVKKLAGRMGLRLSRFFPPKDQPEYFDIIGLQKFQEVFPGMNARSDEDLIFYRTLAPYNPALALISEIKNGEIYQFDPDARDGWRVGARFAYRKVRTG